MRNRVRVNWCILQQMHLVLDLSFCPAIKEVRALRGKFGPLLSQKLKVAFHVNHPSGLLEE